MQRLLVYLKKHYKYLIFLGIGIIIGILINIPSCKKQEPKIIPVTIHDTIVVEKERIKENTKTKYITKLDTFYIIKTDTIYIKDLPIEHKEYQDTIVTDSSKTTIDIQYHGFNADIDSLNIINTFIRKDQVYYTPPKRFGLDITIGPSIGWNWYAGGPINGSPTIGINCTLGISYRITK